MAQQKIIKTGNSSAVTIPAKFMKTLNIKVGDAVTAVTDLEKGHILYKFIGARQLTLGKVVKEKKEEA